MTNPQASEMLLRANAERDANMAKTAAYVLELQRERRGLAMALKDLLAGIDAVLVPVRDIVERCKDE